MSVYLALVIWMVMGGLAAYLAQKRGRNPIFWFFVGLFLGVVGILVLVFLPEKKETPPMKAAHASIQASTYHPFSTHEDIPTANGEPKIRLSTSPSIHWYYVNHEKTSSGPLSFDEIKSAYKEGKVVGDTLVWNEEIENWMPLKKFHNYKLEFEDLPDQA